MLHSSWSMCKTGALLRHVSSCQTHEALDRQIFGKALIILLVSVCCPDCFCVCLSCAGLSVMQFNRIYFDQSCSSPRRRTDFVSQSGQTRTGVNLSSASSTLCSVAVRCVFPAYPQKVTPTNEPQDAIRLLRQSTLARSLDTDQSNFPASLDSLKVRYHVEVHVLEEFGMDLEDWLLVCRPKTWRRPRLSQIRQ